MDTVAIEVDSSGRIHSYIIKNKQQKHTQQNYKLNEFVRKIENKNVLFLH